MAEGYVFEVVVGGFPSAEEAREQLTGVLLDYDYGANGFAGSVSFPTFVRTQPEDDDSQGGAMSAVTVRIEVTGDTPSPAPLTHYVADAPLHGHLEMLSSHPYEGYQFHYGMDFPDAPVPYTAVTLTDAADGLLPREWRCKYLAIQNIPHCEVIGVRVFDTLAAASAVLLTEAATAAAHLASLSPHKRHPL